MAPRKGRTDPKKDASNPHSHQSFQSSNEHNPTPDSGDSFNYAPTFIEVYQNDEPLPSVEEPYSQNENINPSGPSDQPMPVPGGWNPSPQGFVAPRRRINFVRQVRMPHHFSPSAEAYPFLPPTPAPMLQVQPQEQQPQQLNRTNNSPAIAHPQQQSHPQQQTHAPRHPPTPTERHSSIRDRQHSTITPPEYRAYESRTYSHYNRKQALDDIFEAIIDRINELEEDLDSLAAAVYEMRRHM